MLTVILATIAAVQAGSHTAAVVIVLVVLQWMSAVDDPTTPRSLGVAVCLLVFHSLLALTAVTPHSTTVPPDVLRRWVQRVGAVTIATAAAVSYTHLVLGDELDRFVSVERPNATLTPRGIERVVSLIEQL